MTYTRGSGYSF